MSSDAKEETGSTLDIHRLLQTMVEQGASDLHLTVDAPPSLRLNGALLPLRTPPLKPEEVQQLAYSVLNDRQRKQFEETHEVDLSFQWKRSSRFRANFFMQRGKVAGAIRMIPFETQPLSALGLPSSVNDLVDKRQGLVLVTGATGSGKSTTLASIIDAINSRHRYHIITIEDPIEFVHTHKKSVVNQREVGSDTANFGDALRYVMRQDPDCVLIGEIRDLETMAAALRLSETGHLTLATLHTNNAVQTVHRVMDFFPSDQQEMVRTQLSFVLEGVICQQLLPRSDGRGRVLGVEVLLPNSAVRNLIREEKSHQIYSQMQMGQNKFGMRTMNQSLVEHVRSRAINTQDAMRHSHDAEELGQMLGLNSSDGNTPQAGKAGASVKRSRS